MDVLQAGAGIVLAQGLPEVLVVLQVLDVETAAKHYGDAVAAFERAGAPLEAAQARLELARVLATGSRPQRAEAEARRARAVLEELGATPQAARASALIEELAGHGGTGEPSPLTSRQVEILRLAAEGLTEHQVAPR